MDYDAILEQVAGPAVPSTATDMAPAPASPVAPTSAPKQGFDYLSLIDQVQATEPKRPNPDKVFKAMYDAQGKNPDEEARREELAKQLGTQPILLPTTREAEAMLQRKQNDPIDLAQNSPATAKWLEDHAHLAGGDIGKLRKMESSYSDLEYLGKTIKAGGHSAVAAIAKFADALFSPLKALDDESIAILSKGDTSKFKQVRESNRLETFAREQNAQAEAIMKGISPAQKKEYGSLEYFTTDPEKAAYRNPVKMLGDIFQSLPSSVALGATWILAKGAGTSAQLEALASGATPQVAKEAYIAAAMKMGGRISAYLNSHSPTDRILLRLLLRLSE